MAMCFPTHKKPEQVNPVVPTKISLKVNGRPCEVEVYPRTSLMDLLRNSLKIKSVHRGCEEGECGACTVLLDGKPILSCITLAVQVDGTEILTMERIN